MNSARLSKEKPWAILGISRQEYDRAKPWKKARMTKEAFGDLVRAVAPEAIKNLKDEAQAEILTAAIFGASVVEDENSM